MMRKVKIRLMASAAFCLLALFPAWMLAAAPPAASPPPKAPAPSNDPYGRNTPRGTLLGFLKAAHVGNWNSAALYLQLEPAERQKSGMKLSQQLKDVLDHDYGLDVSKVSDRETGVQADQFPAGQERIGTLQTPDGRQGLTLVRLPVEEGKPIWLFSKATLVNLPALRRSSSVSQFEDKLPPFLVQTSYLGIALWKWIVWLVLYPALFAGLWLLLWAAGQLLKLVGRTVKGKALPRRAFGLWGWLLVIMLHWLVMRSIGMPVLLAHYFNILLAFAVIVVLLRLAMRSVDWVGNLMIRQITAQNRTFARSISGLIRGIVKVALVLIAIFLMIWKLGLDLNSALAGLGIGGLALALGAQKTLENLIGGVMVLTDRVLQVGDRCQVGDKVGQVEDFSLRSTRIRTLDGSLLDVPNGFIATISLDNQSNRKRFLLNQVIRLRYDTPAEKVRRCLETLRGLLYAHPRLDPADRRVVLLGFGASCLELEVNVYVLASLYDEYYQIRHELLFLIMDALEAEGMQFAVPEHRIHLDPGLGPNPRTPPGEVAPTA